MDMAVSPTTNLGVAADAITAVTGYLIDAVVMLFENDFTPSPATVIGDLTAATYTGYATEAITWLAPSISDDGQVEIVGTAGEFRVTVASPGKAVYGAGIVTAGGVLIAAGRFDSPPVPMEETTDAIVLVPRVRLPLAAAAAEIT